MRKGGGTKLKTELQNDGCSVLIVPKHAIRIHASHNLLILSTNLTIKPSLEGVRICEGPWLKDDLKQEVTKTCPLNSEGFVLQGEMM